MFKVIVERPRHGRRYAGLTPGRKRALEDDDGDKLRQFETDVTIEKREKYLNENLAPLRRFLEKQIGRPWNKVYSEISEHLRVTSTVQQHVRQHLDDFVARACRMEEGQVMCAGRWGKELPLSEDYRRYFVHPRTGLLKANPHYLSWRRRFRAKQEMHAAEFAARSRLIDKNVLALKLKDDVWWEVKLARIGDGREPDVVLAAGLSDMAPEDLYGRAGVRAMSKRILSKTEKRKLGL